MKIKFHGRIFAAFIMVCMMFKTVFGTFAFAADRHSALLMETAL